VILAIWEPLTLATFVAPRLSSIATRGWDAAGLLVARLFVAALGIAAGLALWRGDPGARVLAILALILSTIAAAVTHFTTILPSNLTPGDAPTWMALVVAHNGAWIVYLALRRTT
jgi:hypothetical protein